MSSDNANTRLLQAVGDPQRVLSERISALRQLASRGDSSLVEPLRRLLARPKPGPEKKTENWDPRAVERVVDLHIVGVLHRLGDDTELQRIPLLVREADDLLLGPDDELHNAVAVILSIGRVDLIENIIRLASENDPHASRNGVRVLDQLDLPAAPLGGSVKSVVHMRDSVDFTVRRLNEELRALEQHSHGSVVLSSGAREYSLTHDYDRGIVRRRDQALSQIVEQDIRLMDFDYFVEQGHVTICTYREAGTRWQQWWSDHGRELEYLSARKAFVLRNPN